MITEKGTRTMSPEAWEQRQQAYQQARERRREELLTELRDALDNPDTTTDERGLEVIQRAYDWICGR
jgi:hypothetical protein